MATERDLETLLDSHPYLLAPELGHKRPERQLRKGRSRLDLLFRLRGGFCVVELKKTTLGRLDVRQMARYCRLLEREGRSLRHHYLVGFRPEETGELRLLVNEVARQAYKIRLRFLIEDVPLTVFWDKKTRRYLRFEPGFSPAAECFELRL